MSRATTPSNGASNLSRRAFTITAVVIASVLLVLVLWKALAVLLLMFAAVLVAVLLRFMSDGISRFTRLSETWSLSLVLVLLLGASAAAIWIIGPAVAVEVKALGAGMTKSLADLEEGLRGNELGKWVLENMPEIDLGEAQQLWSRIGGIGATVFGSIAAFFITLFVGGFLAYNPKLYVAGLMRLVPMQRRERAAQVLEGFYPVSADS